MKSKARVQVTIQEASRMAAIAELAQAINKLARTLEVVPEVYITDCQFADGAPAIHIDTAQGTMETKIVELE